MSDFDSMNNVTVIEGVLTDSAMESDDSGIKASEVYSDESNLEEQGLSISGETIPEFGGELGSLEDFSSGEQEIVIEDSENLFPETVSNAEYFADQVQESGTSFPVSLDDSKEISLVGVILSDEEKTTYLDYLAKEQEFRETLQESLDGFLTNEEGFQKSVEDFLLSQETILAKQDELITVGSTIALNQKEIARTLKINNTLMFALLFGVLGLFGAMLANAIWSRFH